MNIRMYIQTSRKRAETTALLDSGATENFINTDLAYAAKLSIKQLEKPRDVYNVDGTPNRQGQITRYTDVILRTGTRRTRMRFFLTDLGVQNIILGYPWFAAIQPKIDWARGWLDITHLPLFMMSEDSDDLHIRLTQTLASKLAEATQRKTVDPIPTQYKQHTKVFSEKAAQRFPQSREWDHAIELKEDAPQTLPGKIYPLAAHE